MLFILGNITISLLSRFKLLASLIFGIFYGSAYQIGQLDWLSYNSLYEVIREVGFVEALLVNSIGHYEPIFSIYLILTSRVIEEYWVSKSIAYAVSFYFFLKGLEISNIKRRALFVFTFFSFCSFTILFTTDRQAIALMLVLAGFLAHGRSLVSLGFHYSSIIILFVTARARFLILAGVPILLVVAFLFSKYSYLFVPSFPAISSILLLFLSMSILLWTKVPSTRRIMFIICLLICFFLPFFLR